MPFYESEPGPTRYAAAALTTARVFLVYNSSNQFALASASGPADGVQRYAVSAIGDEVTIEDQGNILVACGASVAAGAEVMSDSAGKAVTWTGGVKLGLCLIAGTTTVPALIKFYPRSQQNLGVSAPQAISASGAITPRPSADYEITKAGVAAMTLAAPTTVTDDGVTIRVTSSTAFAHTITATGLLNTGSANVNVATFAAFAGAGLTLKAYGAKWDVVCSVGVTFS